MTGTTTDGRSVHDALAQRYDDYAVHRLLHDVPPHETYEVTVDGRRAVCKVATDPRGDPATEARVMAFVGRETTVPVPTVLALGDGYFVAEWCPDVPRAANADETKARAMGVGLATLHRETADAVDAYGRFEPADASATRRCGDCDGLVGTAPVIAEKADWRAVALDRLADRRAYLESVGHADVADAVAGYLQSHPDAFDGASDPVLCHGNYLPDHVGVDGGEIARVIDFEHALCGPAEYDCWRTLLPLSRNESGEVEAFREGYESVRPLSDGFDRQRDLYSVLLAVSYLKALYLQDQHDAARTRRIAEQLREHAFETLDALERR
ncbi:phosphotransferase [Halostella sp. JP-L12]|uniref:phosphotransferase n=1 Tax=Halostella TaxID=1843185 RepID=UPI000EF844A3|nr:MULTISPECIES: phosphotransferase [Halostella]NHN46075.1 phosphotransferase [Halostella sp. JP-L12]